MYPTGVNWYASACGWLNYCRCNTKRITRQCQLDRAIGLVIPSRTLALLSFLFLDPIASPLPSGVLSSELSVVQLLY